jgi:hypothetical protein
MSTAVDDDIASTFKAALAQDAGIPAPAAEATAPAPPRKPDPAEATARPGPKPRPAKAAKADAKARTASSAAVKPSGEPADYTADLIGAGQNVWFAASMVKGGKVGPVRVPDLRPYAAVFNQQLPAMAAAWNAGAQQNATVRGYVSRLAGDGGVSWVIGVGIATAGLVSACVTIASAGPEVRAELAEANDQAMGAYVQNMMATAGLVQAGLQAAGEMAA